MKAKLPSWSTRFMLSSSMLAVFVASMMALLLWACEKDPVKGWTLYNEPPPPPKIVSLHSAIKNCVPPYPVSFYQNTEHKLGNVQFFWDFGDGNTSIAQNPNHIYQQPGDYVVRLIVANEIGADTAYLSMSQLNAESIPVQVDFSHTHFNNNNFAPNRVLFDNFSTGANQFYWYFGDGQEDNNDNPIHVFSNAGTYTVTMRGTCTDGSFSETSRQVFVVPAPKRVFIDSLTLMLPRGDRSGSIFVEFYHNTTFVGSTKSTQGRSFPVKFRRPNDFLGGYFFDFVNFAANEAFKFVIFRENGSNPPIFLYEIILSPVDIQNRFYPRAYYQIEHVPPITDLFIDLYISY